MFNLLMLAGGWKPKRDKLFRERVLEYTSEYLIERFGPPASPDIESLRLLPTLFTPELGSGKVHPARVGLITRVTLEGKWCELDYEFDPGIPPVDDAALPALLVDLGVTTFETSRSHWAVKDGDLFEALVRRQCFRRSVPTVFRLNERAPSKTQVAAMMPFAPQFVDVHESLRRAAQGAGKRCVRAGDIWRSDIILQDVVSLISGSCAVICDLTGRNPNVFYEMGIAHTLGRPVIPIAQSTADVPFDVRHLRHIV